MGCSECCALSSRLLIRILLIILALFLILFFLRDDLLVSYALREILGIRSLRLWVVGECCALSSRLLIRILLIIPTPLLAPVFLHDANLVSYEYD